MRKFWFLLVGVVLLMGCIGSTGSSSGNVTNSSAGVLTARSGDVVKVDYALTVDGKVIDTSLSDVAALNNLTERGGFEPLEFTLGSGQMILGFDAAVTGMRVGEEKIVAIPPAQGYGEYDNGKKILMAIGAVPLGTRLGDTVQLATGASGKVVLITEREVMVDYNHPLAGKTLNFRIILRDIRRS